VPRDVAELHGAHGIEGTSDCLIGDRQQEYQGLAWEFAERYNAEILARIRTSPVAQDGAVTKDAIEKACDNGKARAGVRLKLVRDYGQPHASTITVSGGGTVRRERTLHLRRRKEQEQAHVDETVRGRLEGMRDIIRQFADDEVLALPGPTPVARGESGWALVLDLPGGARFACSQPMLARSAEDGSIPEKEWRRPGVSEKAQRIIFAIQDAIAALERKAAASDAAFLDAKRIEALLVDPDSAMWIEMEDVHGMLGGLSIRMERDGRVEAFRMGNDRARRTFKGRLGAARFDDVVKLALEGNTFDLAPKRREQACETTAELVFGATVGGVDYRRAVALPHGEARDEPRFERVRRLLYAIADESEKAK